MTDSRALDADRLPWLTNDVKPAARGGGMPLVTWGVTALLVVAGASYWAGRTTDSDGLDQPAWIDAAVETVQLPQPREQPAAPQPAPAISLEPPPRIEPVREQPRIALAEPAPKAKPAERTVRKAKVRSRPTQHASARKAAAKRGSTARRPASQRQRSTPPARPAAYWPRPADAVPLGRIIRIGTYSTPAKNHKAWQAALRRYPQIQGLPKVIGVYRDKNGKARYPLYIMTTARAQSDWLCRRMKRDWRRCVVIA